MEHKPWPLVVLAFIHFIEPLTKILFYSVLFNISPLQIAESTYENETLIQQFNFFLLFPIAGIAIFAVKKWSLPVFLFIEVYVFTINIDYLNVLYQTDQIFLFSCFIFFGAMNVIFVTYLLVPAVRIAYLDPRIRWWEASPRYHTNINCSINNSLTGVIQNISRSGVFITTNYDLPMDSTVRLEFKFKAQDKEINLKPKALVLNKYDITNSTGYGAIFYELTKEEKCLIKVIIKFLDKSKATRRPPHRNPLDLFRWFIKLITTGKGLFFKTK